MSKKIQILDKLQNVNNLSVVNYADGDLSVATTGFTINNNSGDVVVSSTDGNDGSSTINVPVTSVNGMVGDVTIDTSSIVVDSELNSTSTNPVENKAVSSAIDSLNTLVGDTSVADQISHAIINKSDAGHTHDDRYYTEAEIDSKLSSKSDIDHTHDDRYYTETEIDAKLENKVDKVEGSRLITTTEAARLEFLVLGDDGQVEISGKVNADNVEGLDELLATKVDKVTGMGLSTNDYTTDEKNKLAGIEAGANKTVVDTALSSTSTNPVQNKAVNAAISNLNTLIGDTSVATQITNAIANKSDVGHAHSEYVNQNAFSNVIIGTTTIAADTATDTLTLVAGDNITLTSDATNDKVTIASKDTVYTHPSYTARTGVPTANATPAFGGTFKVSQPVSDGTGHITAINSRTITIPNTTATTSAAGLMSASDKSKLDGITFSLSGTVLTITAS